MEQQTPTVGRILHYRLSWSDVARINECRSLIRPHVLRGNAVTEGDVVPLVVVKVWPEEYAHANYGNGSAFILDSSGRSFTFAGPAGVNGQAILDGNDSLWVTSAGEGDGPGMWRWPTRSSS